VLVTGHWSASPPVRLRAYHVEFALTGTFTPYDLHNLRLLHDNPNGFWLVPWATLGQQFAIWKNDSLSTPNDYGTWDLNTDPRDGSSNIEVAAMCMDRATTDDFGDNPYTIAHAWIHAGIIARICQLKSIDSAESFPTSVAAQLQNGPIYVVSTHGERAIQTVDYGVPGGAASSQAASDEFGYFVGSGDPDSRWDLALLDPAYISNGVNVANCKASASWLRSQVHNIKANLLNRPGVDFWGLDGPETP
jgi:hypothetical protein